jgi:CMP-N-acetylneuraminic acid synthetase
MSKPNPNSALGQILAGLERMSEAEREAVIRDMLVRLQNALVGSSLLHAEETKVETDDLLVIISALQALPKELMIKATMLGLRHNWNDYLRACKDPNYLTD